jgi:transcriptional repressor NrdR
MGKYAASKRMSRQEQEDLFIDFAKALSSVKNPVESANFIQDLLSEAEVVMLARRLQVARLLLDGCTYEEIEILDLSVIKKDSSTEPYTRDKLARAIKFPFDKRGYPEQTLKKLLSSIEQEIQTNAKDGKISSAEIGEIVIKQIKKVDKVAYIRFAAVYKKFVDLDDFRKALEKI